jgi:hypothetical protein
LLKREKKKNTQKSIKVLLIQPQEKNQAKAPTKEQSQDKLNITNK